MSCSPQKNYTACKETRKYGSYTGEKRPLRETVLEEAHTLALLDKDFKSTILNMLKELRGTMYKELKEITKMMSHPIEVISK